MQTAPSVFYFNSVTPLHPTAYEILLYMKASVQLIVVPYAFVRNDLYC